jgi:hypothetical protein
MKRHRRLTVIGAAAAGALAVTAITGATLASASTGNTAPNEPGNPNGARITVALPAGATSAPTTAAAAQPNGAAQPNVRPAANAVTLDTKAPERKPSVTSRPEVKATGSNRDGSTRSLARVKAAVLAKYPEVTITAVTPRDSGGWAVSVKTHRGAQGTVAVTRDLRVGKLVLQRAGHRG